ncbi:MAG: hypothetical protein J2P28_18540, partial [Actinobacteria bacterium]|nr:hypothetical protein [Actinomycetota bacterium]
MTACTIVDPTASLLPTTPPSATAPPAASVPALGTLEGRKVALLKNAWPSWHRMTDHFERRLRETVEGVAAEQHLIPNGSAADPAQLASIAAWADAAVVGLANCGSCTAWSYHDALALSGAGIPVVLVVTSEFSSLVDALAASSGTRLPTITIPANPETVSDDAALRLLDAAYQPIVDALVDPGGVIGGQHTSAAGPPVLEYRGEDAAREACHELGWTDGLPVVLPTVQRVETMLAALGGSDSGAVVAAMPPGGHAVTHRVLAANAVMAG